MLKLFLVTFIALLHPVHVSLTSIDYVEEDRSFKVFVRLYYDDLLLDVAGGDTSVAKTVIPFDENQMKELAGKYLAEKLIVEAEGRKLKCRIVDARLEGNELSVNLEYGKTKRPETIVLRNLIMTGLYEDMANMVIVRIGDYERGVKMTPQATEEIFIIK